MVANMIHNEGVNMALQDLFGILIISNEIGL